MGNQSKIRAGFLALLGGLILTGCAGLQKPKVVIATDPPGRSTPAPKPRHVGRSEVPPPLPMERPVLAVDIPEPPPLPPIVKAPEPSHWYDRFLIWKKK